VGLGYVGLPLGMQFARSGTRVIGLDIDHVLLGRDALKGFTVVLEASGAVVLYDTTK